MSGKKNVGGEICGGKDHESDSASADGGSNDSSPGGVVLKKGPWTAGEDALLVEYVKKHGEGNWNAVQKHSGLFRCGKSCRLRWANHLRPNLRKGAFTPEEERVIVELHARIGNKWAKMASQMPGRTDNEIKNYWNTRVKRRQRAGLPLYPPEINLQTSHDNQESSNACEFGLVPGHHDPLRVGGFDIPPVMFDGIKVAHQPLPYATEFPEIPPVSGILGQPFGYSPSYNFLTPSVHRVKRIRDHGSLLTSFNGMTNYSIPHDPPFSHLRGDSFERVQRPFSVSIPYGPDQNTGNALPPQTMNPDGHSLQNGYFSASKPLSEVEELPSFQSIDSMLNSLDGSTLPPLSLETIDTYIQSPPRLPEVDGGGLLQDLIREYHVLDSPKNLSCESSVHSSMMPGETIDHSVVQPWPEMNESVSPISHSPVFSECNYPASYPMISPPSIVDGIQGSSSVMLEGVEHVPAPKTDDKQIATEEHLTKSDEFFMPDFLDERTGCGEERSIVTDAMTSFFGTDFCNNYTQLDSESSAMTENESWGFSSLPWFNMPGVHQMPEQQ